MMGGDVYRVVYLEKALSSAELMMNSILSKQTAKRQTLSPFCSCDRKPPRQL